MIIRSTNMTTSTFLRSHFCRGVVILVLVTVKLQGVKRMFLSISQTKLFIRPPEAYLRATNKAHILYFIVLRWPDRIP